MHRSILALAVPAALASATPDIAMVDAGITAVRPQADYIEVDFFYMLQNVGPTSINLGGLNPDTDNDNVGIQTYLADAFEVDGLAFAASGTAIMNPVVLKPGEFFSGSYTANTVQLANPHAFGDFQWLVIDVVNAAEEPEDLWNNRMVVRIPAPGGIALTAAAMGLAATRRRR